MDKRINVFSYVIYLVFLLLTIFIFYIICIKHRYYSSKLSDLTNTIVYGDSAPRGRIYDRNHNLLVDNTLVLQIIYKKNKNTSISDEIKLSYKVSKHLDLDYTKLDDRNLKEFYLVKYPNKIKLTKEENNKYKQRLLSNKDIENIKINRISDKDLEIFNEEDKKAAYIYYLMNNNYTYNDKIIKNNATYFEYAYFAEHLDSLDGFNIKTSWDRVYLYGDTFKSILGSIGPIPKEEKDSYLTSDYNMSDIIGLSNIEKQYENYLRGKKSEYRKIDNNTLELISSSKRGKDLVLSIDINLQKEIDNIIDNNLIRAKSETNTRYLNKSYVVMQEPNTGEILAISGREIVKRNNDYVFLDISPYALTDPMTPGSVVKGASMLVGYNTNNLKIGEVFSDECVKLYNFPKKCSAQQYGRINDIKALSHSSNVYQFKIAMRVAGINYYPGVKATVSNDAFDTYRNMFKSFGLGVKTEIDLPIESLGYSGKKVSPDLLLNYSIGQYDSYTPIQLSQYITTFASNGNRLKPHLLKEVYDNNKIIKKVEPTILNKVDTKEEYLNRVKEGFIAVMEDGYGKNVMGTSPKPAGKTGTSESFLDTNKDNKIDTETISNSFVGYAPYDNPKMSITVTSPDVSYPNSSNSFITYMNRRIAKEVSNKYFELYQ